MSPPFESQSPSETHALGEALGRALAAGDTVALVGDLGAGKTALVQGVAAGLNVPPEVRITSPTFTLINDYPGGRLPLFHADLYRIATADELYELPFADLSETDGALIVEWADRFSVLPADHLTITLEVTGDTSRRFTTATTGPRSQSLLTRWHPAAMSM
ncbi:MAG TPA: tRNA (adenosine(37)-N6)-threonylcarbamoyltransferase complex ATPase subunit type 1 TsaE [Kofleriaceae bacterium]|nr:tRNA (adenosine(37)-N6)-threonylcarbamoyltransferase complex ATPase subunit type 1 TsaE [Kofleriaceae bacterium]